MRTIIAGSRNFTDYERFKSIINFCEYTKDITEVVSGGAKGVDALGEKWAAENNIPVKIFKANWDEFGKSAGYKRNLEMADYAEALIAIRLNNSKGTTHMINIGMEKGLKSWHYDIIEEKK